MPTARVVGGFRWRTRDSRGSRWPPVGTPTCAAASEIFIGPPGHSLRTLPHSTRQVPALLAEGRWRPRTLPLANVSHLVEHPAARILIDPGTPVDLQPVIAQLPTPLRQLVRPARRPLATVEALELGGVERVSFDKVQQVL